MDRLEQIKYEKVRLEKIKNKKDLTQNDLKFLYNYDDEVLEKSFLDESTQKEVNEILKNRDRYEDYSIIYNCPKDKIGLFSEETIKEILDGRNFVFYHGGSPYSQISVSGNKEMEKINFPDYMIGRIYTKNIDALENKKLPNTMNGQIFMNDIKYMKNIEMPRYSLWTQLTQVKKCDNVKFQSIIAGPLMMNELVEANDTEFPEEIIGYVMMYNLQKGNNVILPKYVKRFFDLKKLESLEGIIIPERFNYGRLSCKNVTEDEFKVKSRKK